MKKLILTTFMLFSLHGLYAQGLTAKEIIKKADEKTRGLSSQATMTMTVVRPDWNRTITMKSWSKGRDYSLVIHYSSGQRQRAGLSENQNRNVELGSIH